MRLLPVIDLLAGRVVRGIGGRRSEYRPWSTPLAPDADPARLAQTFYEQFGFRDAYVADLDALGGAAPQWDAYAAIADAGLTLWLDAGAGSPDRTAELVAWDPPGARLQRLIVGLESIPSPLDLHAVAAAAPRERLVFSLDLFEGRPWTASAAWNELSPPQIARTAWDAGIARLIVLDVARVGTDAGPGSTGLCRTIRAELPELELIGGGGVQGADDVRRLTEAGCDRVLVASALHSGRLTPLELFQNGW